MRIGSQLVFQSTPSRGGRLVQIIVDTLAPVVSIHALTRRATAGSLAKAHTFQVSIHALTRRATNLSIYQLITNRVSIHALTRRATASK